MKTYIVTQTEIVESTDTAAITKAVQWLRRWTPQSDYTDRYVIETCDDEGNPTGQWDVCADDRGQNPMNSEVISTHATEAEATAEADRLNAAIDAELRGLADKIELPDNVDFISMKSVRGGKYPQSRNVTVSLRVKHAELGPIDFEIGCFWQARQISDRDADTRVICDTVAGEFEAALGQAVEARRVELADESE